MDPSTGTLSDPDPAILDVHIASGNTAAETDSVKTDRATDTVNAQNSPEVEGTLGSMDGNNQRFISALQACFADLAKKNEQQMEKFQAAAEGIRPKPPATDEKTRFWNLYQTLADEHDKEFLEKYSTDLDTCLIFAGLFSAVSSAFIIQIQPELQPNPNDMNQALMRLLIHSVNASIFSGPDVLIQDAPTPPRLVVVAQSLLYVSLSCTLLAALLAVLGKQWLMYYSAAGERGTIEARGLERQRKFEGLRRWKFDTLLQMFPLLLQLSLLLFGAALSIYLWTVHR
ncbi:hypothetical protein DFH09DRAFT_1420794, partial [Mycena vulgaris]